MERWPQRDIGPGIMASSPAEEAGSTMAATEGWWELVRDMGPLNSWWN